MDERLLDVQQVCRRLNCSKSHVYSLINAGELLCVKIGRVKGFRVPENSLETYQRKCEEESRQ